MRKRWWERCVATLAVSALVLLAGQAGAATPARVDLRKYQSPIKHQGARGTCSKFVVIAAMEAAYRRAGYGVLDLSEQFGNVEKTLAIRPDRGKGPDGIETLVAASYPGGNSFPILRGLPVPEERYMPYRGARYPEEKSVDWGRRSQYDASSFNLNPRNLPASALNAPRYYSVKSFRRLAGGRDPREIERVLDGGREVIWVYWNGGKCPGDAVWMPAGPARKAGLHTMLIVGYDRTDKAKPYFIAKNSYAPTKVPGAGGYTYLSYGYLRAYGHYGAYITAVNPPRRWPELSVLGRWLLCFDGHAGLLDIYHLPGAMKYFQDNYKGKDLRLGTFYQGGDPRKAYRVNGTIRGRTITFWIDPKKPNLGLGEQSGRKFTYSFGPRTRDFLAGTHQGPGGEARRGYAVRLRSPGAFAFGKPSFRPGSWPELKGLWPPGKGSSARRGRGGRLGDGPGAAADTGGRGTSRRARRRLPGPGAGPAAPGVL